MRNLLLIMLIAFTLSAAEISLPTGSTLTPAALPNPVSAPPPATPSPTQPAPPDANTVHRDRLLELLNNPQLSATDAATLRHSLQLLQQQDTARNLSNDNRLLVEQLRENLQKQYAAQPQNRALALLYLRYLLFLDDTPTALAVLEKLKPASAEDALWTLLMTMINLQLGDAPRAAVYLERAQNLLRQNKGLSLGVPLAVTQVEGYRLYTLERRDVFLPGQNILLYVEINAAQFKVRGSEWQCQFNFSLELRADDKTVYDRYPDYGTYELVYNGKVNELHVTLNYVLPADLPSGKYILRLGVHDAVADAREITEFNFAVGGENAHKIPTEKTTSERAPNAALLSPLSPEKKLGEIDNRDYLLLDDYVAPEKTAAEQERLRQGLDLSRERKKMHGDLLQK